MKIKQGFKKIFTFIKRNNYAFIVGVCMVALVTTVAITAVMKSKSNINSTISTIETNTTASISAGGDMEEPATAVSVPVNEPKKELEEEPKKENIIFSLPVEKYTLGMGYSEDALIYNKTLKEWSTHLGIDYITEKDQKVYAVYDGVVETIEYSILEGTTIVIDHGNDLKTTYSSLSNNVEVNVGDRINKGDVIGYTSDSSASEAKEGYHVHFSVLEQNEYVDPEKYIGTSSK